MAWQTHTKLPSLNPIPIEESIRAALTLPTTPNWQDQLNKLAALAASNKAARDAYDAAQAAEQQKQYEAWVAAQTPVVAAPVTSNNNYDWGSCAWYVASKIKVPDSMGNANNWGYALGYHAVPAVGDIAWTTAGPQGHVAIVEAVNGDQVEVSEMNVNGLGAQDTRWTAISDWTGFLL